MTERDEPNVPGDNDQDRFDDTLDLMEASGASPDEGPAAKHRDSETVEQIGPYTILESLGEGGMGSVYLAEQREPVHREVALKVIKAGMDSGQVIARFEAERQALAMMDHAHIAKVFDAGTTETGRPYFVMELVRGDAITRFCEKNQLNLGQRLELFEKVCHAVQHAHQKGIVHRDLKPTNILVTMQDNHPVPKVIDFGLAKATDQRLTDRTMFTAHGQVLGTLEYMSPEQADLNELDVDTRSDIYSLGVILYELLTGTTPLKRETMREVAFTALLDRIREEEAERPSSRVSHSAEGVKAVSSVYGVESRKLSSILKGDLDWVVMKAIDKDRDRRYESASALSDDIRRFIEEDPVEACPPSASYRLRKTLRKHKAAVLVAASMVLLLVLGITGTTIGLFNAMAAERRATQLADSERAERRRAEANLETAVDSVNAFFLEVSESDELLYGAPSTQQLRTTLLNKSRDFFAELMRANQSGNATTIRASDIQAQAHYVSVLVELGELDAAESVCREALALLASIGLQKTEVQEFAKLKGILAFRLASVQSRQGHLGEAVSLLSETAEQFRSLAQENPGSLQLTEELSTILVNLGLTHLRAGDREQAEKYYRQSIDALKTAMPKETNPALQDALADSYQNLAVLHLRSKEYEPALANYQTCLEIRLEIHKLDPTARHHRERLAAAYLNLGNYWGSVGNMEKAREAYAKSAPVYEELAREDPLNAEFQTYQAGQMVNVSAIDYVEQKYSDAIDRTSAAADILDGVLKRMPQHPRASEYRSKAQMLLTACFNARSTGILDGDDVAQDDLEQALEDLQRLNEFSQHQNAKHLRGLARVQSELGNFAEAERWQRQVVQLTTDDPDEQDVALLRGYQQEKKYSEQELSGEMKE